MTYNVHGGTLNLIQSNHIDTDLCHFLKFVRYCPQEFYERHQAQIKFI